MFGRLLGRAGISRQRTKFDALARGAKGVEMENGGAMTVHFSPAPARAND